MPSRPSYLIIGAGVFGVSTAYHLIKRYPDASVRLVDRTPFPCKLAASWDWNKVIRADYGDIFYMEKALEAIEFWRNDPIFKSFYHQSGLVRLDDTGLGRKMIENYHKLDTKVDVEIISSEQFKERYGGFYQNTNFEDIKEVYINHSSGWAEAAKALTAFTQAAVEAGVEYSAAEISHLAFENGKSCSGVKTANGETINADQVILCTGAGTAKLLADSAPDRPELQVDGRITAACVVTGIVHLDAIDGKKYTEIPVTVHGIASTRGEIMPLVPPLSEDEPYTVKFCRDETYRNTITHEASGQSFSSPPDEPGQAQKTPKPGQIQRLEMVKKGFLGEAGDKIKIDEYRVCWDGITPNQDFIISPHPHCEGLFIATAGSFHGWKFMPTIGRYVTDMLDGTLDKSLVKRWAWDRSNEGSAHGGLIPELELRDL